MSKSVKLDLGNYEGDKYFLYVEASPDWSSPDNYVATVYFRRLNTSDWEVEKVEIVRIENRSHGFCHMDRLFEEDSPKEEKEMSVYDAWQHLEENWKKYARRYQKS